MPELSTDEVAAVARIEEASTTVDSPLVVHAARELLLSGNATDDPAWAESILNAVRAFAAYGHTGCSAAVGIAALERLLRFQVLTPITADDPWVEVGAGLWQSGRQPSVFSKDAGATWYDLDEDDDYPEDDNDKEEPCA